MTDHRHREVLDHMRQGDYRDVKLYDKGNDRMNTLMWIVLFLFSGYVLVHVWLWMVRQ